MPEADASVIIKRVACQLFIIKKEKGKESMKIAVTYDNGNIFQHFGKTETFKVYEVEDNKVVSSEVIGSNGEGHGALAGLLAGQNVDVVFSETTFTNDRQKAEVVVTKQDKDTENPLDGGIFGLYAGNERKS